MNTRRARSLPKGSHYKQMLQVIEFIKGTLPFCALNGKCSLKLEGSELSIPALTIALGRSNSDFLNDAFDAIKNVINNLVLRWLCLLR